MTRKLKTLGLALLALLAISAVLSSVATAASDMFHSEDEKTVLTGTQEGLNKFKFFGQSFECLTVKYQATVTGTSVSEISTVEPTYSDCTFGGSTITISMNGCKYSFTGTTDAGGDAQVNIVDCAPGKSIEINFPPWACIFTVQFFDEGIRYTTVGSGTTRSLLAHLTLRFNVKSDPQMGEGINCAAATNTVPFFTLEGTVIFTGEEDGGSGHVGVWIE